MTEAEFIAAEQAKHDRRNHRILLQVRRSGTIARANLEAYLASNLIAFCRPRDGILYNNYDLTTQGHELLAEIEARGV